MDAVEATARCFHPVGSLSMAPSSASSWNGHRIDGFDDKASQYAVSEASTCDTGYDQNFYSWGEWSPLYEPPMQQDFHGHQLPSYGFGNGDLFTAQDYENTCAATAGMWVDNGVPMAWY